MSTDTGNYDIRAVHRDFTNLMLVIIGDIHRTVQTGPDAISRDAIGDRSDDAVGVDFPHQAVQGVGDVITAVGEQLDVVGVFQYRVACLAAVAQLRVGDVREGAHVEAA